jgi:hypothetical protein
MNNKMEKVKKSITDIDYILTGTILTSYKQCGKVNCRCMKDVKQLHGPYYIWTRKEKGKTVTKTLTLLQAKKCRQAIKNMKKLNVYIESWKKRSIKYIDSISDKN